MRNFLLLLILTGLLLPFSGTATERRTPVVRAVEKTMPCVVAIGTEQTLRLKDPYITRLNEYFALYRYRTRQVKEYQPLGSGVVVCADGVILTNWHVIRAADNIVVRLQGGASRKAKVIGYDAQCDLCLLQLQGLIPAGLKEVDLAKHDDVFLGETVIALGNPFGLENSVATGVLSAVNRTLKEDNNKQGYDDILQTDAAINPGNSGGPLLNLDGELIGINQAIRSNAQGIGFAIPIKRIEKFMTQWLSPENFSDVRIPFRAVANVPGGVKIQLIRPDSPAAKAGLKNGDVISAINGRPVKRMMDLCREYRKCRPGDTVTLAIAGQGSVILFPLQNMSDAELIEARLGLRLRPLTLTLNQKMGFSEQMTGLIVEAVLPDPLYKNQQARWKKVVRRGDVLLAVGPQKLARLADLANPLRKSRSGDLFIIHGILQNGQNATYYKASIHTVLN